MVNKLRWESWFFWSHTYCLCNQFYFSTFSIWSSCFRKKLYHLVDDEANAHGDHLPFRFYLGVSSILPATLWKRSALTVSVFWIENVIVGLSHTRVPPSCFQILSLFRPRKPIDLSERTSAFERFQLFFIYSLFWVLNYLKTISRY